MLRLLYRWLRWLAMIAIVISVLVACNTGDTPLTFSPQNSHTADTSPPPSQAATDLDPFSIFSPSSQLSFSSLTRSSQPSSVSLLSTTVLADDLFSYHPSLLPSGDLLIPDFFGDRIQQLSPSGQLQTLVSGIDAPTLAVPDPSGHIWILDTGSAHLHRLAPDGSLTQLISDFGWAYAAAWAPHLGELLVATHDFSVDAGLVAVSDDGSLRTLVTEGLGDPVGLAVKPTGEVIVSDYGTVTTSGRLLQVSPDGQISLLATGDDFGELWRPTGIDLSQDTIYFADFGSSNDSPGLIRSLDPTGQVNVVASLPIAPFGLQISGQEMIVSDFLNGQILKLTQIPGLDAPAELPIPQGEVTLEITNREQVDGIPLTIEEQTTVRARAVDANGQDVSSLIQWLDAEGQLLGQGSTLSYTAAGVKMETLTAQIETKRDRVSFTVSTPDAVLQPHVKVLSNQAADNLLALDWQTGSLELVDDLDLTTIQVGDVLEGAEFQIPPVQVVAVEKLENTLQLQIVAADPRQVIKRGVVQEWQEVQIGSQGEIVSLATARAGESISLAEDCTPGPLSKTLTLPVFSSPVTTKEIEIPNPWNKVKQVNASLSTALDVDVVTSVSVCPVLEPPYIEFHEEGNLFSGIRRFEAGGGFRDLAAETYLQMNGLLEWSFFETIPDPPYEITTVPPLFVGQLGPVSVWVSFNVLASVPVEAGVSLSVTGGKVGVGYGGGRYIQRIKYEDDGESGKWDSDHEFAAGSFNRILEGEIDLDGYLQVGLNPEIEPEIWGSPPGLAVGRVKLFTLPKIGLLFYVRGELDLIPENVEIEHIQPTNTTLDGTKEITLEAKASGDPELRLLAGVDLTLRDGSVEECPNSEETSSAASLISNSCIDFYIDDNVTLPSPIPPNFLKPPLPLQTQKCYSDRENQARAKCYALPANAPANSRWESHHIVQNKAVKGYICGYSRSQAPTILLLGPSNDRNLPHGMATDKQQHTNIKRGTLGAEFQVAREALNASSAVAFGPQSGEINRAMKCADGYFSSLDVNKKDLGKTPTNPKPF